MSVQEFPLPMECALSTRPLLQGNAGALSGEVSVVRGILHHSPQELKATRQEIVL